MNKPRTVSAVHFLLLSCLLMMMIDSTQARCVMYEPCAINNPNERHSARTSTRLQAGSSNPFDYKWANCLRDEPEVPLLTDRKAIEDFRRICAPLYEKYTSEQPSYKTKGLKICCSANQIEILKRDLGVAEAIFGSCASCYLNFKLLWCHMSCDPNQHEFVIPTQVSLVPKSTHVYNFTQLYQGYMNKAKGGEQGDSKNEDDYDDAEAEADEEAHEDEPTVNEKPTEEGEHAAAETENTNDNQSAQSDQPAQEEHQQEHNEAAASSTNVDETINHEENHDEQQNHDENNHEQEETNPETSEKRRKRRSLLVKSLSGQKQSIPADMQPIATTLGYFVSKKYLMELIDSCR